MPHLYKLIFDKNHYISLKPFISFAIKVIFLLFLLFVISASYFILLISVEQKSFPFLVNKIESKIKNYIDKNDNIIIENIRVEQDNFNIIAYIDNVKFNHSKLFLEVAEAKVSFSIFDLILFQTSIKNLDIKTINIKYHSYLPERVNDDGDAIKLHDILPNLLDYDVEEANIHALNVTFLKKDQNNRDFQINDINLSIKNNKLKLSSKINFEDYKVNLKSRCYIQNKNSICNALSSEINPEIISKFYPKFSKISGIKTKISSNITIKSNNKEDDISFILYSDKGEINNKNIVQDKVTFTDLTLHGDYKFNTKSLNVTDFSLNFMNDIEFRGNIEIDNILKPKFNINLFLNNLTREDAPKLWPVIIPKDDNIKKLLLRHIKSFYISDSHILMKFSEGRLLDIDAKFNFTDASILYDRRFPAIYDVSGKAYFNKKSMRINIDKGSLLKSKIKNAEIIIKNFHKENTPLEIRGKVTGRAEDLIKHVNYKSYFSKNIGNYINGSAISYFDLLIPIKKKLQLRDIYLQIYSAIRNINNSYIGKSSNLRVNLTKNVNDNIFRTHIDLTKSQIDFKPLSISKQKNINSTLSLNISPEGNLLTFSDIKFKLQNQNLLTGFFLINLDNKNIQNIKLTHPDFSLLYDSNHQKSYRKLDLKGKKLDLNKLKSILQSGQGDSKKYKINDIEIILDQLILANNIELHDVDVSIKCHGSVCINSFIEAKKGGKEIVNIDFHPYPIKKTTIINGKISDISSIMKGVNIYDKITDGDLVIRAKIFTKDNDAIISGEAYNKKAYKILKGELVQKISEDRSFSRIKDQLILEDQIKFEKMHSKFNIKNNILEIEKFIISNNYLGVTAKGHIDINNNKIDIKGLVVPGYLINGLFGIGELPIIKYIFPILVGEEGGGIFAGRYRLEKNPDIDNKLRFKLNKSSVFAPGAIRNFFD